MGAFGLGLVQGFATSTDAALKTHIQDNKDRFDENLTAALTRNLDRSTRYDKKSRDANDALELMSGLTNGNLDQAASIIASIGGVGQTQGFVDAFRTGQQTKPDLTLDSVVNYIGETKETDLTNKQAINQLVQPFEFTKPAQAPKRTGLAGMFDDPRDITTELSKTLSARGIKPTEINNLIKLQGAKVDWSKLATPKQQVEARAATAGVALTEQKLEAGSENIKLLKDQVNNLPVVNKRKVEAHNAAMTSSELNIKDKTKRLAVFEANNTPEMISLSRRLTVANTIKAESGSDAEEQYNLLDTRALHYKNLVRENSTAEKFGDDQTIKKVAGWMSQLKDIEKSKAALLPTIAADASTIYSKDSPKGIFNDKLRTVMQSIPGLKFKDTIAGTIADLKEGQAGAVVKAYKGHYAEMQGIFGKSPHQGIQNQLLIARSNARQAESLVFGKMWATGTTGSKKAKPLYQLNANGSVRIDPNTGYAMYNKNVKLNDAVIINDPIILQQRRQAGYTNPAQAIYTTNAMLGAR